MQVDMSSVLNEKIMERLQKVENYCGIKFPESYVDFVKKYNVGIPITNEFVANNHAYAIGRFLGFVGEYQTSPLGNYDIAVVLTEIDTRLSDNPDLTGDEMIPIAELFAGDYVCLDYRENADEPSICVWDHEESDELAPVTYKAANSFSEFIEMLR